MQLKKAVVTGAAAAVLVGAVLNVSAAPTNTAAQKESGKENLIINVEAYKAAYSDLAAAFGDDTDAYLSHYLTIGVYEGRTKGVLFDPLTYAAAYPDVKQACGDDISAIVNHYVTFGVAENRTVGTAVGYTDIAEAEKNGMHRRAVPRNTAAVNAPAADSTGILPSASTAAAIPAGDGYAHSAASESSNGGASAGYYASSNTAVSAPAAESAPASSVPAPAPAAPAPASGTDNSQGYHHTTSIYTNDESTLLRVEYYDDNNKLFEYSSVSDYDKDTNSYTETIYGVDNAPVRTDTYVNGELTSSEKH